MIRLIGNKNSGLMRIILICKNCMREVSFIRKEYPQMDPGEMIACPGCGGRDLEEVKKLEVITK